MTKAEILACRDADRIWTAMQENPALKADREVWDHMTGLHAKKEKAHIRAFFGAEETDTMAHIDYQKKG